MTPMSGNGHQEGRGHRGPGRQQGGRDGGERFPEPQRRVRRGARNGVLRGRIGRSRARWAVARAMLRDHRVPYAGVAVVVAMASALVGSQVLLLQASRLSGVDTSGMSAPRAVWFLGRVYAGHLTSVLMLAGGALAALVLVAQAMCVAVQGRRRELALLCLAGASPARVRLMVAREALLLGLAASTAGALVAVPTLRPLADLLASQDNWAPGYVPAVTASGLVLTVVVMTAVTAVGALVGVRGAARAAAVEAVRESAAEQRRGMTPARWAVAAAGAVLTAWVWAAGPARLPWEADDGVALWVGGGAAVCLCALAPILAGPAVRAVCLPVRVLDPGAGLTAWAHARTAARRAGAVVVPVAAVVALATIPVMASNLGSGRDYRTDYALSDRVDAALHLRAERPRDDLETAWRDASTLPATGAVRARTSATSWMVAPAGATGAQVLDRARRESFPLTTLARYQVTVTAAGDPAALVAAAGPRLVEGEADDVHGTGVALRTDTTREDGSAYRVGDSITLLGADGGEVTLRVAALFEYGYPLANTRLLADDTVLPPAAGEPVTEDWFLTAAPGGQGRLLASLARTAPTGAAVTTGQGWTDNAIAAETRRGASNDATLVGGICLLAAAVIIQQTLALIRSRRDEGRLLRRAGASRTTIVLSALAETAGLQLLGLAIAAITIAVTWAWLAWALVPYYDDLTAPPAVPWLLLIAGTVVALVVPQVVALGAALRAAASGVPPRGAGGGSRGPR